MNYLQNRNRRKDLENKHGWQGGGRAVKEFGTDMNMLLYLKWRASKVPPYSAGSSAQCYVAAWMGGDCGGEWIHVHARWSPFAFHLKLSQRC